MKSLLLVVLVFLAAAAGVAMHRRSTADRRAWHRLLTHEGKDLTSNVEAFKVLDRITAPENQDKFFVPWRLLRLNSRVILLESNLVGPYPRPCLIRSHVFSEEGDYLTFQTFGAGASNLDDDARTVTRPEVLLELRSGWPIESRYYSLTDDRLSLVRIDNRSAAQ